MSSARRNRGPLTWSRLDNAAKIFPPTVRGADTRVFRLSCELTEMVEPQLLERALADTLERFPHMQMVLRRGVFWYYLEQSHRPAQVVPEHAPPCAALYSGSRSPLYEVSWWRSKVNLDVFHVLTDGAGAIAFFQELIAGYLALRYPGQCPPPEEGGSVYARGEDGFAKYYQPKGGRYGGQTRAFHLRGQRRDDCALTVLEGVAYRRDIIQNIGWQVALMPVLSILWDVGMGFQGWSLDFVLPCVCATGVLMMLLLAVLLRLPVQSLAGALGGVCVLGLIPGLLAGLGKLRVLLPSLLCTGLSVVVLAAMLIFHWQTFRGELARRFHL